MSASSYEIQVFRNNEWTIRAFFDDKELALVEARRISESNRFPAVRVIEEIGDPELDDVKQRVVYRWSEVDKPPSALGDEHNHAEDQAADRRRGGDDERGERARQHRPPWLQPDSFVLVVAKGGGIVLLGAALIYGINVLGS